MGGPEQVTRRTRRRSVALVLLVWALLVSAGDVLALLRRDGSNAVVRPSPSGRAEVGAATTTLPPSTTATTVPVTAASPVASATPVGVSVSPPSESSSTGGTGESGVQAPRTTPTTVPAAAPDLTVHCSSELPLEQSPDAPFNFLCTRGDEPLTWRRASLTLRAVGLSFDQQVALQAAIAQFEEAAGFTVSQVTSAADVELSVGSLTNGEGGHATMHYTCTATCAYDHADVVLSTTRGLTEGVWLTTILHELGHVAGLNHVHRSSQVMYPTLTLSSPVLYADGDRAGFAELQRVAAERGSSD